MNQEELTTKIQEYFKQFNEGCGNPICTNVYCKTSFTNNTPLRTKEEEEKRMNLFFNPRGPNEWAALALELAAAPRTYFCTNKFLEKLRGLSIQANKVPLIRLIGSTFSSSPTLVPHYHVATGNSSSCYSNNDIEINSNCLDNLDTVAITTTFNILTNSSDEVVAVLQSTLQRLAAYLETESQNLTTLDLQAIGILFLSPIVADPSPDEADTLILGPLAAAIGKLPTLFLTALFEWVESRARSDRSLFEKFVNGWQQFLTLRLLMSPDKFPHNDRFIINTVKLLEKLYIINNSLSLLPSSSFVNELIGEKIDLKEDFVNWKNQQGFSFCNYPFLLDPAIKSQILHLESLIEMRTGVYEGRGAFLMNSYRQLMPVLVFKIRRDHLVEDCLLQLTFTEPTDLKKELRIHFVGEEGVDEGGVKKEWFQLLVQQIFDASYGMFTWDDNERIFWFNSSSTDFVEFNLMGKVLGLAIYNGVILDIHFPPLVYRMLVAGSNYTPSLEDLKSINPGLYRGFKQLLDFDKDADIEGILSLNFQIEYELFGEKKTYDLKPNGANIPLTYDNREEYIDLYISYLLKDSISRQWNEFYQGFKMVCNGPAFDMFRADELELLICGSSFLDFTELEKVAIYEGGYSSEDQYIKNFWEIVHEMSSEEKKKLLFFCTGSDRCPIGGLGKLPFIIIKHGPDTEKLPTASTCFNYLLLPTYSSKQKLKEKLLLAINNATGFGLA